MNQRKRPMKRSIELGENSVRNCTKEEKEKNRLQTKINLRNVTDAEGSFHIQRNVPQSERNAIFVLNLGISRDAA